MIKRVSCTGVKVSAVKRKILLESGFTFSSQPCFPFMRKSLNCREHCSFGNREEYQFSTESQQCGKVLLRTQRTQASILNEKEKRKIWLELQALRPTTAKQRSHCQELKPQSTCHQGFSWDRIVKTTQLRTQNCRTLNSEMIARLSSCTFVCCWLNPTGNVLGVVVLYPLRGSASVINAKKFPEHNLKSKQVLYTYKEIYT